MTKERFEEIVKEGIGAIPKRFLERLDNVDICIEEEPTPLQFKKIRAKKNFLIFGLYEGIPKTKRGHYDQALPDKITIFKKPIEQVAHSEREIKEVVRNTVWHEIAHHFGMDEQGVRKAQNRRKRK